MPQHISTTTIGIVLAMVAAVFFGAFVLYGAWIDGRRQKLREQGRHPVTLPGGAVTSEEAQADERDG